MQEHEIILYQLEDTNVYVNVIFIEQELKRREIL